MCLFFKRHPIGVNDLTEPFLSAFSWGMSRGHLEPGRVRGKPGTEERERKGDSKGRGLAPTLQCSLGH